MSQIPKPAQPAMPTKRSPFQVESPVDQSVGGPPPAAAAPIRTAAPSTTAPASSGAAGRIRRIMLELPDELKQRLESAQINTAGRTGLTSQQAFIREAIARLCTELEVEHNGGVPWPPLPNRS